MNLLAVATDQVALTLGIMTGALFAILLGAGFVTKKWSRDSSDYLLGGREVGLLINVFGVCAIGFAGTAIAFSTGWTVWFGMADAVMFNVAYLGVGIIMYGILFTKFIRRNGAQTLPEWLEMRFNKNVRLLVTITTTFGLLGILANNIASMAGQISGFTGWPQIFAISITFGIFVVFTYLGGFWAVTVTDFIQMIVGFIALPTLLIALISTYGTNIVWPTGSIWANGVNGGSGMPILSFQYPSYLTVTLAFGIFLVWGNNYYWLRVASCRSERVASKSYILAGIILFFVINAMLIAIGAFAGSFLPTTTFPTLGAATGAFGAVLQNMPVFIASIALLGSLAASVSTATTAHIGATAVVVRDIYNRRLNPKATQKQLVNASKIVMVVLAVMVYFLSYFPGGPSYLFAFANAFLGPSAALVFMGAYYRKATDKAAFWGSLVSIAVIAGISVYDLTQPVTSSFNAVVKIYPGALGVVLSFGITLILSIFTKPKYYGDKSWTLTGEAPAGVKASDEEKQVLDLIRKGYNTMGEITDYLQVDSYISNDLIESLDQKRLIQRGKLFGADFYKFELTAAGKKLLPTITDKEDKLLTANITVEEAGLLAAIKEGKEAMYAYVESHGLNSLKASTLIAKLVKFGYLNEAGLMKRKLSVTEKGNQVLA